MSFFHDTTTEVTITAQKCLEQFISFHETGLKEWLQLDLLPLAPVWMHFFLDNIRYNKIQSIIHFYAATILQMDWIVTQIVWLEKLWNHSSRSNNRLQHSCQAFQFHVKQVVGASVLWTWNVSSCFSIRFLCVEWIQFVWSVVCGVGQHTDIYNLAECSGAAPP